MMNRDNAAGFRKTIFKKIVLLSIGFLLISRVGLAQKKNVTQRFVPNNTVPTLSIDFKKVPLGKALNKVAQKTGIGLSYETTAMPSKRITYKMKNASLYDILDALLKNTGLYFVLSKNRNTILIKKHHVKEAIKQGTVTGVVTNAQSGKPLPGVNIKVKGTTTGTTTNAKGHYSLSVSSLQDTLVFSYIGYKTKMVPIRGRTNVTVKLVSKTISGKQMVVIGYGKEQRQNITGAVSSVSGKQLKDEPTSSLAGALAGRLSGVSITKNQGGPGAGTRVRIRGTSSITQGNSPLYIVDGVQVNDALSTLSPSEIKSVTVLKDAAATAIYGARGSNGVVLITTKKGHNMPLKVTYNGSVGTRHIVNKLNVMNPYHFVRYQYMLYNLNTSQQMKRNFQLRYGRPQDFNIYHNMPMVNWQDRVFGRSAIENKNELTFTGGSKGDTYRVTLNHLGEQGIMLNSGFHRSFISFKFDHEKQNSPFQFGLNVRYDRQGTNGEGTGTGGTSSSSHLRNAVRYKPYLAPGQKNEIHQFRPQYAQRTNLVNPVLLFNNRIEHNNENELLLNGDASYNFTKHLTLKSRVGWVDQSTNDNRFNGPVTNEARRNNYQPIVNMGTGDEITLTNNNTLHYKNTFATNNKIDLLLGQEVQHTSYKSSNVTTKWLPKHITAAHAFANIQKANPPSGKVQPKPTTSQYNESLLSYFGRIKYNYSDKYLATFTLRDDGSSKFPPKNRYKTFPSGAIAWRISNQKFLSNVNWLSNLKLRLSYGTTGNDDIGNNLYQTEYVTGGKFNYAFHNSVSSGLGPNALANANIRWETTISKDAGLDFSFLNSRIHGSVDVYVDNSKHLLLQKQIPVSSGFSQQIQNVGSTRNKGIELQIGGNIVQTGNFQWNANLNISANRNKITSLGKDAAGNPLHSYLKESGWVNNLQDFKVAVGQPVGEYYGYVTDGYYHVNDFNYNSTTHQYTLKKGVPSDSKIALGRNSVHPGDIKLKDLNGDGKITQADRKVLGNAQPKFHGGLSQTFDYKDLSLSVMVRYAYGNKEYNANKINFTTSYIYTDQNMLSSIANRFKWFNKKGNMVTNPHELKALNSGKNIHWDPPKGQYFLRSSAIENASYIRISNVTLSYSIPQHFFNNIKYLSKIRVYGTVHDLYTFTGYSGYNPLASTRGSTLTYGVDYASYPLNRYVLGGLSITF